MLIYCGQLGLGYIEFFESLVHMMERIGGHLSYLSEYATGTIVSQNLHRVQQVSLVAFLFFPVYKLIYRLMWGHTVTFWTFMLKCEPSLWIRRV